MTTDMIAGAPMAPAQTDTDSNWDRALPVTPGNTLSDEHLYERMALEGGTGWTLKDGRAIRCVTRHIDKGWAKMHKYCVKLSEMPRDQVAIPVRRSPSFRVKPEKLGLFYRAMDDYIREYRPYFRYSEYIEAAYELARDYQFIDQGRRGEKCDAFVVESPDAVEYCNRYFRALHALYQSEAFREKLRSRRRQSQRISDRLNRLVYKLFWVDNLSRLCVVRVDLEYVRKNAAQDASPYYVDGKPNELAIDAAQADLQRYFGSLRGLKLFKGKLVGYAWRLHFGEGSGYHFHVILFLDGDKAYQDSRYAKAAIGLWKRVVGVSARAYSSNFKKQERLDEGKSVGIGMINRNDHEKVQALREAANYLAHQEQLLYVMPGENGKTFDCSKIGKLDEELFKDDQRQFPPTVAKGPALPIRQPASIDPEVLEYRRWGRMRGMAKTSKVVRDAKRYCRVRRLTRKGGRASPSKRVEVPSVVQTPSTATDLRMQSGTGASGPWTDGQPSTGTMPVQAPGRPQAGQD